MRIATMVNGFIPTPQPLGLTYAPIDIGVAISEGLQARGHSVDYYAPQGSHAGVPVISAGLPALPQNQHGLFAYPGADEPMQPIIQNLWEQRLIEEMLQRAQKDQYDILLLHADARGQPLAALAPRVPVAYTLHNPITPWRAQAYKMFATPNQYYISISDAQRRPAPDLPYAATIYNGIDPNMFAFSPKHDGYLLCVGRIIAEKGVTKAIQAAKKADERLRLFGEILPKEPGYFKRQITPLLNNDITYEGFIDRRELADQYRGAKALLLPIRWEEPFGMVMIEAMACGTPVIAFRHGSVPEVIVDGKTGFIVDTVDQMAEAIKKIDTIDRQACRDHVIKYFSNQRMVEQYETALQKVLRLVNG